MTVNRDAKEHMTEIKEQNNARQKAALGGKAGSEKSLRSALCKNTSSPPDATNASLPCHPDTAPILPMGTEEGRRKGAAIVIGGKAGAPLSL